MIGSGRRDVEGHRVVTGLRWCIGVNTEERAPSSPEIEIRPAMPAGISDRLWSMEDLAALVVAADTKPVDQEFHGRRAA